MKRSIRALALALALVLTLGTAALAAETGTAEKNGVTVTPETGCEVAFKSDSDALTLSYQNEAMKNDMVLLLVLKDGANDVPTEKDILYIDQTTADADGKVSFETVYPTSYQKGTIRVISAGGVDTTVARVDVSYQLGDVNMDGIVDIVDALRTLQHAVGKIKLTDEEKRLANVNGDEIVDIVDALRILQYSVGKITSFDITQ